ncbi:hypothetical protein PM082_024217 [Marasmius tenuissimus]|nr:hypothetical protein PM082_024217 [Marasmius tenuissimus]
MYEEPGETRASNKGTMRGPGVLDTFAHHRKITRHITNLTDSYGMPSGALALSAMAYFRALTTWQGGFDSIAKAQQLAKKEKNSCLSKNNEHSFNEELWAPSVIKYHDIICTASPAKWRTILYVTDAIILQQTEAPQDNVITLEPANDDPAIVMSD